MSVTAWTLGDVRAGTVTTHGPVISIWLPSIVTRAVPNASTDRCECSCTFDSRIIPTGANCSTANTLPDESSPPWKLNWLTGQVTREQGHRLEAEKNFRKVLEDRTPEMIEKGFDFSLDIEVINLLGLTQFDLAKQARGSEREEERKKLLQSAVETFKKTLKIDSEDISAHYNLHLLYKQ